MDNRKTKIICTLGPAVGTTEKLRELILAGMNGARFNFSHGDHESHMDMLNKLRSVRDNLGRPIATILDTKGPEIRIRSFADGRIELKSGDTFQLTAAKIPADAPGDLPRDDLRNHSRRCRGQDRRGGQNQDSFSPFHTSRSSSSEAAAGPSTRYHRDTSRLRQKPMRS